MYTEQDAESNCLETVSVISFIFSQTKVSMFYSGGRYFEFKKWYEVVKRSLDVKQKKLDEEKAK